MSVQSALGLSNEIAETITAARWDGWCDDSPDLTVVPEPSQLRPWLLRAEPPVADRVLLAIAELAAVDGGHDSDAATLLCWLLLPAACRVARCIDHADIDEHVAAQLWIEVRTFSWRTTRKVAANIAGRLRKHVLADLANPTDPDGQQITWLGLAPVGRLEPAAPEPVVTSVEELLDLLDWGCASGVISEQDRQLLLDLIAAASAAVPVRSRLLSDRTSEAVAARWGVSGRTVRRWAARSIHALAESA